MPQPLMPPPTMAMSKGACRTVSPRTPRDYCFRCEADRTVKRKQKNVKRKCCSFPAVRWRGSGCLHQFNRALGTDATDGLRNAAVGDEGAHLRNMRNAHGRRPLELRRI